MKIRCSPSVAARAANPPDRLSNPQLCALCGNSGDIKKSHIVPRYWFKLIKGTMDKMHIVARNGVNVRKYFQDGPKTKLLCGGCEGFINDEYEKYFLKVWATNPAYPDPLPSGEIRFTIPDHCRFKLFHLSVLWRAAAAAHVSEFAARLVGPARLPGLCLTGTGPSVREEFPIRPPRLTPLETFPHALSETVAFAVSDRLCCNVEAHNPRTCRRNSAEHGEDE